jgi:TnpA family transposase
MRGGGVGRRSGAPPRGEYRIGANTSKEGVRAGRLAAGGIAEAAEPVGLPVGRAGWIIIVSGSGEDLVTRRRRDEQLHEQWRLVEAEFAELGAKVGAGRLGFACLLKYFSLHARFPRGRAQLPAEGIEQVATQVGVPAADLGFYDWSGRSAERHRAQIRSFFGFRPCTVVDAEKLTDWLGTEVCRRERRPERVRTSLLDRCREEKIEPPSSGRVSRIVASALRQAEGALTGLVASRLPPDVHAALDRLIVQASDDPDPEDGREALAWIKTEPGPIGLETIRDEVGKLGAVRAIGLSAEVFADIEPGVVAAWRSRATMEAPSHLRTHPEEIRLTLLAALIHCRGREITDTLVDLLIGTVHRIGAKAEKKVKDTALAEFKRVTGKENILFSITEASVGDPEGQVQNVVYPAAGGIETLLDLQKEFEAKGSTFRQHKQRVFKASYTHHYRAGLIAILDALEFHSTNPTHRPVLEALKLIRRYRAETSNATQYYALGEHIPVDRVVPAELVELLYRTDKRGRKRVFRTVYECGVFQTLRDKLRCKEIWVTGADRWRNPDEDLPADFEERRVENYRELGQPLDADEFVERLRGEMHSELAALNKDLPKLPWLEVKETRRTGAIHLSPLEAVPEPANLRRLKTAIRTRWGVVPLLDMLTETALRTGCLQPLTTLGAAEKLDPAVLFERILLLIYAYGTGAGIRAVAAGSHGHAEHELRYIRRRYLTVDGARQVARMIVNATFAARWEWLWGTGSTAVASDSTHATAFDQNIFTEWHSRYKEGKRGVLIYWTVEPVTAMAVYSQLLSCSASEVHAMVEGAMRHETNMDIQANYVDSHGASFVGFGITRLLGFDLLPRIKQINHVKLYRPEVGAPDAYPRLEPALTRPIRWELIERNYDAMVKYATAIRQRTASTESILRRFTKDVTHPAYAAMLEVGRAERTCFVAKYLRRRELQREIGASLNVVENYNGVGGYIRFGNPTDLPSNRREEQELGMLCLQILQSSLGLINMLLIQEQLAESGWVETFTGPDWRGLTPLFTTNMTPYGDIALHLDNRLTLANTPDLTGATR